MQIGARQSGNICYIFLEAPQPNMLGTKPNVSEPDEARALIENALGYALAAEKDFTTAVRHYKAALRAKEDYPVAINNLAYAQERLLDNEEACALYRQTLVLDPKNKTARKRLNRLERAASKVKSSNQVSPKGPDGRGF